MAKSARRRKKPAPGAAREAILAAAEARLTEHGPAALRLQDVAADVGVSHPAILHHFGSREGLVSAVVDRAVRTLEEDLVRSMQGAPTDGKALLDRVFETLAARGHARLMAWLLLSGKEPLGDHGSTQWRAIIDATHAARTAASPPGAGPPLEDTAFAVVLSALAIFGQAIAGPRAFELAGLGRGDDVDRRFRTWLAALLGEHLSRVPTDGLG